MTNTTHQVESIAKLRWQCRRGMLELDLLLSPFLETHYAQLSIDEQKLFVQLLSSTDQDLYDWLVKQQLPSDASLLPLIKRVQAGG